MAEYKFVYNGKEYRLVEDNCSYVLNDEENPVEGIGKSDILELLNRSESVEFGIEYYDEPCENCQARKKDKEKFFEFLEYHFFIFAKKSRYIISSISKEYESSSLTKLLKQGVVDNSYIVSIIVCVECGDYSIEVEQCEI